MFEPPAPRRFGFAERKLFLLPVSEKFA